MPNMTSTPRFPEILGTAGDCQGMPIHMRFFKYSLSPYQTTSDPSALEMEVQELRLVLLRRFSCNKKRIIESYNAK
jgi:hypothetical protein